MRKPRLTDRVLRGIIALSMPAVADVINGSHPIEDVEDFITAQDVADAERALEWAHAMVRWKEYLQQCRQLARDEAKRGLLGPGWMTSCDGRPVIKR
jgi:hypothetical protein